MSPAAIEIVGIMAVVTMCIGGFGACLAMAMVPRDQLHRVRREDDDDGGSEA